MPTTTTRVLGFWGVGIGRPYYNHPARIGPLRIGYVENMSEGTESVPVEEARREIAGGSAVAVDVRSEDDWNEGHIPGAIHLPDADPEAGTKELEQGARLMVIAGDGKTAGRAAKGLSERGYDAIAVDGGMKDWISEDFNVQPTVDPDEDTELGLS